MSHISNKFGGIDEDAWLLTADKSDLPYIQAYKRCITDKSKYEVSGVDLYARQKFLNFEMLIFPHATNLKTEKNVCER